MNITKFCAVNLRVRGVGPFRGPEAHELDLTDAGGMPANMCVLVSANGMGKTTLVEAVAHLVGLLADGPPRDLFFELSADDEHMMQLDVLVEALDDASKTSTVVLLTLFDGVGAIPLYTTYTVKQLSDRGVDRQVLHGVARSETGTRRVTEPPDDVWFNALLTSLAGAARRPVEGPSIAPAEAAPTVLYFSAYRNLLRVPSTEERTISRPLDWTHHVVRVFDREDSWAASLDKLFVWLYWLDGERTSLVSEKGRFEQAKTVANEIVFEGLGKQLVQVRKDPPEILVQIENGGHHRLDQLSSGERNLLQLFVRIAVFGTKNTIVVIDEVDVHLHPRWEQWVIVALKRLVAQTPGLSVILTAHSIEVLKAFALEVPEAALVKTADVIQKDLT